MFSVEVISSDIGLKIIRMKILTFRNQWFLTALEGIFPIMQDKHRADP